MIPIPLYGLPSRITQRLYPWTITTAITGVRVPEKKDAPVSMFAGISSRLMSPDLADTEEKKAALEKIQKLTSMLPEEIHPIIPGLHDPDVTFLIEATYHMPALPGLWGRREQIPDHNTPISLHSDSDGIFNLTVLSPQRKTTHPVMKRGSPSLLDLRPFADFLFTFQIKGRTKLSHLFKDNAWNLDFRHATWLDITPKLYGRDAGNNFKAPRLNNVHGDGGLCTGEMPVNILNLLTQSRGNVLSALDIWMRSYFHQRPNQDLSCGLTHRLFNALTLAKDNLTFIPHDPSEVDDVVKRWDRVQLSDKLKESHDHLPPLAIAI